MQLPVYFHDVQVGWLKQDIPYDSPPNSITTAVGTLSVSFMPGKGYSVIILADKILNDLVMHDELLLLAEPGESSTKAGMRCSRCGEIYFEEAMDGCRDLDCPQTWSNT